MARVDISSVLLSLGGSAAVSVAVATWLLKRAEKEIDRRLEEKQTERLEALKLSHRRELQVLEAMESRLTAQFSAVSAIHGAAQSASLPKSVEALDQLWKEVVRLGRVFPPAIAVLDFATEDEYAKARTSAYVERAMSGVTYESFSAILSSVDVESVRPFISETLWQYFFTYRAFLGRVCVRALDEETRLMPWYKDSATCELLASIVPADYVRIIALPRGRIGVVRKKIESLILEEMHTVLSGEKMSAKAVEHVQRMQEAVTKAPVEPEPRIPGPK
jgi:hypothetical protein